MNETWKGTKQRKYSLRAVIYDFVATFKITEKALVSCQEVAKDHLQWVCQLQTQPSSTWNKVSLSQPDSTNTQIPHPWEFPKTGLDLTSASRQFKDSEQNRMQEPG